MTRHIIPMALAAAILATAGAPVASAGEKATVKASAAWVGQGRIFRTGLNDALFLGAWGGVLYVESEEGKLDAVDLICPGTVDIELKSGAQEGSGNCAITDEDGDQVFATWTCDGKELMACQTMDDVEHIYGGSPDAISTWSNRNAYDTRWLYRNHDDSRIYIYFKDGRVTRWNTYSDFIGLSQRKA